MLCVRTWSVSAKSFVACANCVFNELTIVPQCSVPCDEPNSPRWARVNRSSDESSAESASISCLMPCVNFCVAPSESLKSDCWRASRVSDSSLVAVSAIPLEIKAPACATRRLYEFPVGGSRRGDAIGSNHGTKRNEKQHNWQLIQSESTVGR